MKKILLGFIAIGLLKFVGCKKDEGNTITNSNNPIVANDADGKTYASVIIGIQEWMTDNLRTIKYSDGISIPNVIGDAEWGNLSTGAWSNYDNDSQYETTYGKLYNWYAVETGKLCPTSWHVPIDADWTVLKDCLGINGHNGTEVVALKATSGWSDGNGTDDYGFSGLPGGACYSNGYFYVIGDSGGWWSSSEYDTLNAWGRSLGSGDDYVIRANESKGNGFSIRCLRD